MNTPTDDRLDLANDIISAARVRFAKTQAAMDALPVCDGTPESIARTRAVCTDVSTAMQVLTDALIEACDTLGVDESSSDFEDALCVFV